MGEKTYNHPPALTYPKTLYKHDLIQGWAFAAGHPGLQLLLALGIHSSSSTSGGGGVVPPPALLERVAARRAGLAQAARADEARAEAAVAARVAAAAAKAEEVSPHG